MKGEFRKSHMGNFEKILTSLFINDNYTNFEIINNQNSSINKNYQRHYDD